MVCSRGHDADAAAVFDNDSDIEADAASRRSAALGGGGCVAGGGGRAAARASAAFLLVSWWTWYLRGCSNCGLSLLRKAWFGMLRLVGAGPDTACVLAVVVALCGSWSRERSVRRI